MMTGRPPIPIALKRLRGDTKKLGANKFAAQVDGAFEARRGRPTFPFVLRARKGDDAGQRGLLANARRHWLYLADQLEREQLLAEMDEGMLTGVALAYARMIEAARDGDDKAYSALFSAYTRAADRMGLNESARARLPKRPKQTDALMDALCA